MNRINAFQVGYLSLHSLSRIRICVVVYVWLYTGIYVVVYYVWLYVCVRMCVVVCVWLFVRPCVDLSACCRLVYLRVHPCRSMTCLRIYQLNCNQRGVDIVISGESAPSMINCHRWLFQFMICLAKCGWRLCVLVRKIIGSLMNRWTHQHFISKFNADRITENYICRNHLENKDLQEYVRN